MNRYWKLVFVLFLAPSILAPTVAHAAAPFPTKRIEVVIAGNPGGGIDATARAIERALIEARLIEQPLVMNNMSGGSGDVAKTYVAQKKNDPYYLYVESNRIYQNKLLGTTQIGIDEVTPLARLLTEYLVWVVLADAPFRGAKDVLEKLKADPGSVVFGVGTVPSNDQMNILRPVLAYGVDPKQVKIVPFKSGGDLMIQLLGGHVPVISTGLSEAIDQVRAGRARLLSVSSPQPLEELARVPTWRSLGIGVEILHWRGLFAPPGVPASTIKYWDDTLAKTVQTDAWKKALDKFGWYNAYAGSSQFREDLDRETKIYAEILTKLGMAKGAEKK